MNLDTIIAFVCTLAISLLGLVIFVRNPAQKVNRLFAFLALSIASWTIFNFVTSGTETNVILFRLVFITGILTAYSLLLFIANFPNEQLPKTKNIIKVMSVFTAAMSVVVFMPEFIVNVTAESIITGNLYPLFIIYTLLAFSIILILIRSQLKASDTLSLKQQARAVSYGIILYAVLALASNVLIPLFVDNWSSSRFGPAFSLILVALVGYSVVRHKLFDIRFIVFRSVAYVLTLFTIGLIAFEFLTRLSELLDSRHVSVTVQNSVYVTLTLVLALSYQPLRRVFDSLTKKLFFRDAYETQQLLNEFNETIVSTLDLEQLLLRAGSTIEKYIKPDGIAFAVRDTEADYLRIITSDTENKPSKEAIAQIREYVHKSHDKLFVTDTLEESQDELKQLLQSSNIGILARITSDINVEGTGYIMLGYKKSGNMYNSQDTGSVEILANELAIAIQNALQFEEIQKFNITLQEKIDEATKRLRRANDKLKTLDETKDEFISMASHQLRTPLTSVKGYLSMVLEGDAGEIGEMQRKLLDQAFVSSQRMVYLIADLLNVSRLRTGKFVIEATVCNLADVVEGEISQLKETAAGRGLELTYDKPADFPSLYLDETKVRQVIMNFTDNAIYYTPKGGHIKVSLADKPQSVEFTVQDDGIGIPRAEQAHMFTKFYRAANAKKARPDGTGLGLFMAKKVIVTQGGSILFSSTEGKGSTFGFSFPKDKLKLPDK